MLGTDWRGDTAVQTRVQKEGEYNEHGHPRGEYQSPSPEEVENGVSVVIVGCGDGVDEVTCFSG